MFLEGPDVVLSREDWIRAGLRVLANAGIDQVHIEYLARELHISKGSFYHYWKSRAEFLNDLLSVWEERSTQNMIEDIEQLGTARVRLEALFDKSFSLDKQLESAVHHWANIDTIVALKVARVEQQRIRYIQQLLQETGIPSLKAEDIARIYYFAYLGWIDWSQRNANGESQLLLLKNALLILIER